MSVCIARLNLNFVLTSEKDRDKEKEVKETEEVGVHHEKRKLLGHGCTKRRQISKTQHN